jgi:hypothetical protein
MERDRIEQIRRLLDYYRDDLLNELPEVALKVDEESLSEEITETEEVIAYLDKLLQVERSPNRVALILEQVAAKTTTVEVLAERPEELVLIINQEPFGTLVFGGPHGRPICKLNTVKEEHDGQIL